MYGNLDPIEHRAERVVIILVGLIGAGKSTFAEALQEYVPQVRRCNQDELGNRRRVEEASRSSLREGFSACIDRTNLDSTYTRLGNCLRYAIRRTNHPTITDANHGMQVLSRFASTMELPHPAEGYDKLITLTLEHQPPSGYTKQDVLAILQRLRDAPPVRVNAHGAQGTTQPHRNQRGGGSRYSRGRGRGRGHNNRARRGFPLGNRSEYQNGHGSG